MDELTLNQLKAEVRDFVQEFSMTPISILYGVTDGKAVGTYVEQAFHKYLLDRYAYSRGNSASGIDLPELGIDIKATSIRNHNPLVPFVTLARRFTASVIIFSSSCMRSSISTIYVPLG